MNWRWFAQDKPILTQIDFLFCAIYPVIPVFNDDNNLNKTETHAGNTVEMICQSEAKPTPRMYFKREGYDERYVNGYQPVSIGM